MDWPTPSSLLKAAKTAGGWVRDKVAGASDTALEKGKQMADAVARAADATKRAAIEKAQQAVERGKALANEADRIAREKLRTGVADAIDSASGPVARVAEGYQGAKAGAIAVKDKAVAAKDGAVRALDAVKEKFGMAPPATPVAPCPVKVADGKPQDGGLMVPSDACPADAIPVENGDTAAALAKAKAASKPSTSACCAGKSEEQRNQTIVYVNGIMTTPEAHCRTLRKLRDMTCGKVVGVLNASEGPVTDIIRTNDARDMIKKEIGGGAARDYAGFTPAVKTMKDVMAIQATSAERTTVFAHSEGGAITSLAATRAKAMLTKGGAGEAMGKLNIISMGAAAPAWPDGPNYEHYIHVQDAVPNTVGLADAARRPGAGAKVIRFGGRNGAFNPVGEGDKKPWTFWTPGKDPIADHYADSSYLEYMNNLPGPDGKTKAGCFGEP